MKINYEDENKQSLSDIKREAKQLLKWKILKLHSKGNTRNSIIKELNTNKTMVGNTINEYIDEVMYKNYTKRTETSEIDSFLFNQRIYTIPKAKIAEDEFFAAAKLANQNPRNYELQQDAKIKGYFYATFRTEQPII